ncbi:FAD-dependent oxidoreductase [Ensifer sesbaniae]|uniref:FAD-dependent oxidoreductase n=1 Tax=Ensifer sesbaniae TaxID=1214071 RepID=UPI0015681342|nr:FAD-dependent oxidoreductase [Ensifer sesbaniae]NRQ19002.1 Rhodocoxin reductase [Ensifer sesbaniae]
MTAIGTVEALWRYPISSVGGEKLDQLTFDRTGVTLDRAFGLFDATTGEIVFPSRQRHWNAATLIDARLDESGSPWLTSDGVNWLRYDDPRLPESLEPLFGRAVAPRRYGEEFKGKAAEPRYDRSPIHLLSLQSMNTLQEMLPDSIIDVRRFRPNVVVDLHGLKGRDLPELALLGQEFSIGGLRLRGTLDCGRCSFTTLKQIGLPEDRAILRALISRFDKNFGIYCEVLNEAEIRIGDSLIGDIPHIAAKHRIVIAGGGQAGGTAARALRELGFDGEITILSDERHAPYERPPLSKRFESGPLKLTSVLSGEQSDDLRIGLHLDEPVIAIDRERRSVTTSTGARHGYDHLILATGGTARRLPLVNRGHGRVHTIRNAADAENLGRAFASAHRIFVVGGGWLGLEVAAAARSASIEVDLFVRQDRLLSRVLPRAVADFVADAHVQSWVRIHFGTEPRLVERADRVEAVVNGETLTADLLVVAIGISPNDHLARQAGLDCREGILTDLNGATSDPHIFAIGDVSCQGAGSTGQRIESWQNENEQAYRAARAILAIEQTEPPVPTFWSDQFDMSIQVAGTPNPSADAESSDGDAHPFWNFGSFAVGINRQRDIHRFASQLAATTVQTGPVAVVDTPAREMVDRKIGKSALVGEGVLVAVTVEGVGDLVVTRKDGRYFALKNKCPHAEVALSEGFIEGDRIVCPAHFAEFDMATGSVSGGPKGCPNTMSYAVALVDGELFVRVPA